jgi:hypothetical protein
VSSCCASMAISSVNIVSEKPAAWRCENRSLDYGCGSAGTVSDSVLSDARTLRSISDRIGRMKENR